jgi:hypothetical protein
MKRCAALAGQPFLEMVGDVDVWAEAVRIERNDAAHHLGQAQLQPAELFFLNRSLYYLYVLCFLREMSAPQTAYQRLEENQEVIWFRPRLRAAIGT